MTNVFDNRLAINISTTGAQIANKLTRKYAGKSGTTNTDNWMIGYNADIVLGVWTGYDKKIHRKFRGPLHQIHLGRYHGKLSQGKGECWYEVPKTSSASKSIRRQASSPRKRISQGLVFQSRQSSLVHFDKKDSDPHLKSFILLKGEKYLDSKQEKARLRLN